jgi:hypothetical protein
VKMINLDESKKVGPKLIISILREAKKPLTTRELQQEVHKRVDFCLFDSVVALNLMRLSGTIMAKRNEEGAWVWGLRENTLAQT